MNSTLEILKSCLKEGGVLDPIKVCALSPRGKPSLIYSNLNETNAHVFCLDAVDAIAENILISCASGAPFEGEDLTTCLDNLLALSLRGDLAAGISLALLIHCSKCSKRRDVSFLRTQVALLFIEKLKIRSPPPIYEQAIILLHSEPLATTLLRDTGFEASSLDQISIVFVEYLDSSIRGWCGPSLAAINLTALAESFYLEEPIPLAVLMGHEKRHALIRKLLGDNLNFSAPAKPELIQHPQFEQICQNRISGLWFELTAIGAKFNFSKERPDLVRELLSAIREGLGNNRIPALSEEQVNHFNLALSVHNGEMGFDCCRSRIVE
jgi:hypothetical protein